MEPYGTFSPKPSNTRQIMSQVNAFETELGFLLGECATINVMLNSLRTAFRGPASATSRSADIQREILIDYDDLSFKVKQLERKFIKLEMEFKATQQQHNWF
ncbi:hypothetical protein BJV82DRAFT_667923 [Fennellomyces sp. T-0311]|nr:hypothetical protein BJV82DRAFT_667923 [Fennellomyces sp. T-0311]